MGKNTELYMKKIEEVTEVPTLPSVVYEINRLVRNPAASAVEVGKLISEDLALSARTLKLVNSPFYGFPRRINSITHAVVILGFNKIKNIALSASIVGSFRQKSGEKFDFCGFWEHSIGTAIAADNIARLIGSAAADSAFVAALLHDIGKIVIARNLPEEFEQILELIKNKGMLMREAEEQVTGIDHSQIGAWLGEKWGFPEQTVGSIESHHHPSMARRERELTCIVHVADIVARALEIGNGGDKKIPAASPSAWGEIGLSVPLVDKIMEGTIRGKANAGEFFKLIRRDMS